MSDNTIKARLVASSDEYANTYWAVVDMPPPFAEDVGKVFEGTLKQVPTTPSVEQINELVAEEIMDNKIASKGDVPWFWESRQGDLFSKAQTPQDYTSDINLAMKVFDEICKMYRGSIETNNEEYTVEFMSEGSPVNSNHSFLGYCVVGKAHSKDLPYAICLAALRSKGVDV